MDKLHLDKKLIAYWDHSQGLMAYYGQKSLNVRDGYSVPIALIIANAADRGAVHAR